ncbi:uncharacterized protein C8R40DRAFT_1069705 [Lentinula edodes]|uniref:uncharacterized protein n=1 Tax=Lentinula edodes TaxID=5353 RepID=UPI001E8D5119|nr:uncharacterized protein C8R40DRAFT_1069705 [Lentinula edodes]KAH7875250.1 hypothetical protein C8R40DRAFT_1069705 [Lentinula edodes]
MSLAGYSIQPVNIHILTWYESPVLDDGLHTVNLSKFVVDVDYAIITVGLTTPVGSTSTIIVDDSNTEIKHQGSGWNMSGRIFNDERRLGTWATVRKFNSSHGLLGQCLSNLCPGSSIAVFAVFGWTGTGSLTLDFSLDNQTTISVVSIPSGSTPPHQETPNYQFLSSNLTSGNHTLFANDTDTIGNQTFVFDYLTYIPSFELLANKPDFTDTGTVLPTPGAVAAPTQGNGNCKHVNTSVIVGCVVGGLVGLTFLAAFAFIIARRWHKLKAESALVSPRPMDTQNMNTYASTNSTGAQAQSPSVQSFASPVNDKIKTLRHNGPPWPTPNPVLYPLRYGESTMTSLPGSAVSGRDTNPTQAQMNELRRRPDDITS